MISKFITDPIPLEIDQDNVIRVSGTRITLDTVIYSFNEGATAEEIVYQYPTLKLADVYAIISYYLHQRQEVDEYLRQRQVLAEEIQRQNEANYEVQGIRERLLARRSKASD